MAAEVASLVDLPMAIAEKWVRRNSDPSLAATSLLLLQPRPTPAPLSVVWKTPGIVEREEKVSRAMSASRHEHVRSAEAPLRSQSALGI